MASQTGSFGYNDWDLWILKLDSSGEIAWQKAYGSIHAETFRDIKKTSDSGFIIASDHTPGSYSGIDSIWIIKLDEKGEINWEKKFYGGDEDRPKAILKTTNLDFLVAGQTGSFDSDGNFCRNCGSQGLLVKLDKNGNLPDCPYVSNSESTTFLTAATITETSVEPNEGNLVFAENTSVEPEINESKTATICITPEVIKINIDIKPGSIKNCININDHGVIPVAILGTADFDVTQVDPATCFLEGMGVKVVGKKEKYLAHIKDINNDDYDDLLLKIEDKGGNLVEGQTEATLTGALYDGTTLEGSDYICILPKKNRK